MLGGCGAATAVALLGATPIVMAQDEVDLAASAESKVSGAVGVDYASHFVSYGVDVWGGGDDFYGDDATTFVWAELSADLDPFSVTIGVWSDINDNAVSGLGGEIQEVDVYAGIGYSIDRFSFGATYQEWYYGADEERIVDLSMAFDDSDLLFDGFALNPSVVWHIRADGNGAQEEGSAIVLAIEPSFTIIESDDYPVTLSIPAGVGIFLDDDFQGGTDDGYAYSYIGATVGMPLGFVPDGYGDWAVAANLTYYFTEGDAIPGNPEEDFLTGMISLSMGF